MKKLLWLMALIPIVVQAWPAPDSHVVQSTEFITIAPDTVIGVYLWADSCVSIVYFKTSIYGMTVWQYKGLQNRGSRFYWRVVEAYQRRGARGK